MSSNLLLVDDDNGLRNSVSLYLTERGFEVNAVADTENALLSLRSKIPDLIISDIVMPESSGYNFIQSIKENSKYASIPFVFLTAKGMTEDRILGYTLGCHAYLTKPFDPEELLSIIKSVLNNYKTFSVVSARNDNYPRSLYKHLDGVNKVNNLTHREQTILCLLLQGMMNKEIASFLGLNIRNVEKYVSRLFLKTGTRNRTELARYFYFLNYNDKGE
jgi:DNA-binding NarL/FixJ family response regulator